MGAHEERDARPKGGPSRSVTAALLVTMLGAVVALGLGPGGVGVASADHEPAETNFTFEPMEPEDHRPGAENIRSGTVGQAAPGVDTDLETLLELRSVYSEGSWADCGPTRSETFGIDRGGDNERYEVDESLRNNVERFSAGEDVFVTEFYDEDDYGASTYLNSEDRVLALIECVDNPDEPGWYRIDVAAVTGRTEDGEEVTFEDPSHYFWICRCEDEAEAREELGPPPSEPEETPTATPGSGGEGDAATGSGDPDGGAPSDTSPGGTDATPSDSTADGSSGGTATHDGDPTPSSAASTASPTPADWNEIRVVTPARADAPGFGPWAAVAALLGTALLLRRDVG